MYIGLLALFLAQGKTYNKIMLFGLKNKQICVLVLLAGVLLCAQKPLFAQRGNAKNLYKRAAGEAARSYPGESARKASKLIRAAGSVKFSQSAYPVQRQPAPSLEELRRSLAELEALQKTLLDEKVFLEGQQRTRLAVFQAIAEGNFPVNTYSGTVFKVNYQGKEEIFGVIASHTLAKAAGATGFLEKEFRVAVQRENQVFVVPGRVVQVSSSKMLDLALVKFNKNDEDLFQPLVLGEARLSEREVYSHGFACGLPMTLSSRTIKSIRPGLIKTSMPLDKQDRAGLCGSAVLNKRHELVGIHTGSSSDLKNPAQDMGYVVPSNMLVSLVKAYHHGGQAFFPLILNKRRVGQLNVDEFIASVELLDAQGRVLWRKSITGRYSPRQIETQLNLLPKVRYIKLVVGKSVWNAVDGAAAPVIIDDMRHTREIWFDWKQGKPMERFVF